MIAKKARLSTQAIYNSFLIIQNKIKEVPKDIEKLTEIREFMQNTVPQELEKQKVEMTKCFDIYKILEGFNYKFSKEDMDRKWTVFGSPKDTMELIAKRSKELEKEKLKFFDDMKLSQEEFRDVVDNLERTI